MSVSADVLRNVDAFKSEIDNVNKCIDDCKALTTKPSELLQKHEETNAHLYQVTDQLNKTVKLIKRTAKSETDSASLNELSNLIELCDQEYRTIIGIVQEINRNPDVKIPKSTQKHISQLMLWAAEAQRELNKTSELISKKVTIITQKEQLKTEPASLARLNLLIEKLQADHPDHHQFFHDFFILVNKIKLKNRSINPNEVDTLIKKNDEEVNNKEIGKYLAQLQVEIQKTKTRKILLLRNLEDMLADAYSKSPDDPERKAREVKCYIIYQQIQNNPFDLPLKIDFNEVYNLPGLAYFSFDHLKDLITNHRPDFTLYSEKTLEYKMEGLQLIRDQYVKDFSDSNKEDILISGAGPAGLMYALIYALQGRDFTMIEARGKDDPMRKNIVALGKEVDVQNLPMFLSLSSLGIHNEGDLKLLEFFGIIDDIHVKNQTSIIGSPDNPEAFSVSIENLQKSMMQQLLMLTNKENPEDLVQYHTRIDQITSENDTTKNAELTYTTTKKDSVTTGTIQPKVVHVCEGYRTTTRDLMGVEVQKQSTAEPMVFSFFNKNERAGIMKKFSDVAKIIKNLPRVISQTVKFKLQELKNNDQSERNFFNVLGKFELLLQSPQYDYFYATLTPEEKQKHDELKNQMQNIEEGWANDMVQFLQNFNENGQANDLIDKFSEANRKKWFKDDEKRNEVFDELREFVKTIKDPTDKPVPANVETALKQFEKDIKILNKKLDSLYRKMSKSHEAHNIFNRLLLSQKFSFKKYHGTVLAESQIYNAEVSDVKIGNTRFSLDGDTKTATDPASGSGLRTSILRATFAPEFYTSGLSEDPISRSAAEWAVELNAKSMREEGFYMRDIYAPGTERIERYLDIAKESKALSQEDCDMLLKLRTDIKQARSAERFEHVNLSEFRKKLKGAYNEITSKLNSFTLLTSTEDVFAWPTDPKLSPYEQEIFVKAWKSALIGPDDEKIEMSSKERNTFKSACGKLALARDPADKDRNQYNHLPEAWFVYLHVYSQHLEDRAIDI